MTEEAFDELRPSAFAIAYRMLGTVSRSIKARGSPIGRAYAARPLRRKWWAGPALIGYLATR
jgi:hypothetical protein